MIISIVIGENSKKGSFYKDVETSLYYLNSRYYNLEIGRFINADGLIGQTEEILSHNMYVYTSNNPVMRVDPSGYAWYHWAIAGAVVVGLGRAVVATAGGAVPGIHSLEELWCTRRIPVV